MQIDTGLIIAAIISTAPAWYGAWAAHRAQQQSKANAVAINRVQEQTNGMTAQLIKLTGDKARTEGIAEGKATEIKRAQEAGNV
jgi:hypothetical protein